MQTKVKAQKARADTSFKIERDSDDSDTINFTLLKMYNSVDFRIFI